MPHFAYCDCTEIYPCRNHKTTSGFGTVRKKMLQEFQKNCNFPFFGTIEKENASRVPKKPQFPIFWDYRERNCFESSQKPQFSTLFGTMRTKLVRKVPIPRFVTYPARICPADSCKSCHPAVMQWFVTYPARICPADSCKSCHPLVATFCARVLHILNYHVNITDFECQRSSLHKVRRNVEQPQTQQI